MVTKGTRNAWAWLWLIVGLVACLAAQPAAQSISRVSAVTKSATLSTINNGTPPCAATACVAMSVNGFTSVGVQVVGTCGTCTLQFEATIDGTNWVAVNLTPLNSTTGASSTAAPGVWQGPVAAAQIRARMSALSSGNFTVTLRATLGM